MEVLKGGQFPILTAGTKELFVKHTQSMPMFYHVPDHGRVETGYLKITDTEPFNLFSVCQSTNAKKLAILELVYVDEGDNLKVHSCVKLAKINLADPAYKVSNTGYPIVYGHTTKLCNKRWGFVLSLDPKTGNCLIRTDKESPIIGLKIRLE